MRSPVRDSLRLLILAATVAGALPGTAAAGSTTTTSPASSESSCKVPVEGELRLPAPPPASLGPAFHNLGAEAQQARAAGVQPLNNRGYGYDSGRTGMDAAALDFESSRR